jgi:small GTP-binding protein
MLKCKVCMLGAFAVGKTSLVRRFVSSIFSDSYLTTVGVKIDSKTVSVAGRNATLMLWDIQGEDPVSPAPIQYMRGASGYILVADGTRPDTLETAMAIRDRIRARHGDLPFAVLLNKADLSEQWSLSDSDTAAVRSVCRGIFLTSALTGRGVESAFRYLAEQILAANGETGGESH